MMAMCNLVDSNAKVLPWEILPVMGEKGALMIEYVCFHKSLVHHIHMVGWILGPILAKNGGNCEP